MTKINFPLFISNVNKAISDHPSWRYGQALYNVFRIMYPSEAEKIVGTKRDPFYQDKMSGCAAFFEYLGTLECQDCKNGIMHEHKEQLVMSFITDCKRADCLDGYYIDNNSKMVKCVCNTEIVGEPIPPCGNEFCNGDPEDCSECKEQYEIWANQDVIDMEDYK